MSRNNQQQVPQYYYYQQNECRNPPPDNMTMYTNSIYNQQQQPQPAYVNPQCFARTPTKSHAVNQETTNKYKLTKKEKRTAGCCIVGSVILGTAALIGDALLSALLFVTVCGGS